MMNLQELRASLEAHSRTIKVEDLPDEDFEHYLFWRLTYETDRPDEAKQEAVCIIIDARGEDNERAWFKGKPRYIVSTEFKDKVATAAAAYQEANENVEHHEIEAVNEAIKTAIVRAYIYDPVAEVVAAVRYLVWEKLDASLGFRKLAQGP